MPQLASAYLPECGPWLQLLTRLAKLATAFVKGEPSSVCVTETGWIQGKRDLVERAVKIGCCVSSDKVNLVNIQSLCKTTVTVVEGDGGDVSVECDGVKVTGSVYGGRPVLTQIGGQSVGIVELSGCVLVAKGTTLSDVVQQVPDITEVSSIVLSEYSRRDHCLQSVTKLVYEIFARLVRSIIIVVFIGLYQHNHS